MSRYLEDPERWKVDSALESYPKWQNVVAYESATSIENLGVAAYFGAIPLDVILPCISDAIIDDWLMCRDWVESYRAKENVTARADSLIHYHRSNGEWLSLVAAMWMDRYWNYPRARMLLEIYGGPNGARSRIAQLSHTRGVSPPLEVTRAVLRYVGE